MQSTNTASPAREPSPADRDRLEIIRFPTREARRRAIRVLVECGMLDFATNDPDIWTVRTDVVRALQKQNVSFEWVTGNQP